MSLQTFKFLKFPNFEKDVYTKGTFRCELCKEMKHVFCEAATYHSYDILVIKHPTILSYLPINLLLSFCFFFRYAVRWQNSSTKLIGKAPQNNPRVSFIGIMKGFHGLLNLRTKSADFKYCLQVWV